MTKYWYRILTVICPICGRWKTFKTREYGPKPIWITRHPSEERYDGCQGY